MTLIKTVDFGCYSGPKLLGAVSDPAYTSELLDASDFLNSERGTLFVKAKERPDVKGTMFIKAKEGL